MSIDRRSFVQTAAAAVGGAAGLSGDAVAQDRIQLAQAAPSPLVAFYPAPDPGGGPWKPYDPNFVADQAQKISTFLAKLFAEDVQPPPGGSYRDRIWNMTDSELRDEIGRRFDYDVQYPDLTHPNIIVRVMVVDIQNGRVKFSDGSGCVSSAPWNPSGAGECSIKAHHDDPGATSWYTLILPPLPDRYKFPDGAKTGQIQDGYLDEMRLEGAWHHAIVYGYGM
jgi:hypothetical protein